MLELFGMFVLALAPIIWLVIALCGMHMQAHLASLGALVVAAACAMLGWGMTPVNMATAALEGFAMALWPIVIVIIAAVFTYNVTVHTSGMETIKAMLCSVSDDKRILTLLIAWCFGGFLEGMAGFGTAVAIPASMLLALGVSPVTAILACLIANGVPTMFGSIGIPTTTLASITGIDAFELAFVQAVQVLPFVIACPVLMVALVGGGPRALRGSLSAALVAGLSFGLPMIAAAQFVGPTLADVVAATCSLVATFLFALTRRGREVPAEYQLTNIHHYQGFGGPALQIVLAWSPFILILVALLLTSQLVPAIYGPLSSVATTVNIYAGDPSATLTFTWIDTPGVIIIVCGIVGGFIQGCSVRELLQVLADTSRQMAKTIVTMLGVLACAKIMGYSGMIASIARLLRGRARRALPRSSRRFWARWAPSSRAPAPPARSSLATFSSTPRSPSASTRPGSWRPTPSASPPARCSPRRTSPSAAPRAAWWVRTERSSARSPSTRSALPSRWRPSSTWARSCCSDGASFSAVFSRRRTN